MIFYLPVLSCLGNVSDRCSWLPKKTPKPFSPCQGLTPSQQTRHVAQSERHVLFAVPTDKGLWPPQANLWLAGAGDGAPRGGSDSEKIKRKFWSQPSDSRMQFTGWRSLQWCFLPAHSYRIMSLSEWAFKWSHSTEGFQVLWNSKWILPPERSSSREEHQALYSDAVHVLVMQACACLPCPALSSWACSVTKQVWPCERPHGHIWWCVVPLAHVPLTRSPYSHLEDEEQTTS